MSKIRLHPTRCALCNTEGNARELYSANFDVSAFNPEVFSARRLPDRIHYRLVKCNACELVRSDPIPDSDLLTQLYGQSSFDYSDEVVNLKLTYGHYLAKLDKYDVKKKALLEIGCGNGFLLEEAKRQGYSSLKGIEPSIQAIEKADPSISINIICDIMRPGLFKTEEFDVICMFQVLDHIADPASLIEECQRILKPGGFILCISHNIKAMSAYILKGRSPIIDIEHTYLFSPDTIKRLFSRYNFQIKELGSVFNKYTLRYLAWLFPLPSKFKAMILSFFENSDIGSIPVFMPLGNFYLIAQKPFNKSDYGVDSFNRDIQNSKSYLYTTNYRISSHLANCHLTNVTLINIDFKGKKALDIGCGDGTYTIELFDRGKPTFIVGVDLAVEAIDIARKKVGDRKIIFEVLSAHSLPYQTDSFDVAHLRGILHHANNSVCILREALRVSPVLILQEPNGYNPFLKLIERFSKYHREHNERSFFPLRLDHWIMQAGGRISIRKYIGCVPFFCPDWLARILRRIQPFLESIPLVNSLICATYMLVVMRTDNGY